MWIEKNGKTWRIREDVAGQRIALASGFATKTAAARAMTMMKADALRGDSLIPRGGQMTLSAWIDTWWPTYKRALKETSRVSIEGVINRYIKPMLGHYTLDHLHDQPLLVQGWVNDLLDGKTLVPAPRPLAAATVRNAHGQLYVIFGAAINQKLIRHNPCDHTSLPEEENDTDEMLFLTHEQAGEIVMAMPVYWRPLIMLFLATGLRWSEAMGLRVRDVDLVTNILRVRINRVEIGGRFVDQTPKTKRGRRPVSFQLAIGEMLAPLMAGKKADEHIFRALRGGDIRHKDFYVIWWAARASIGLPGLRLHDLRHTHVAWLISANVPLSAISKRVGHKSVAFTDARYGHLLPEVDDGIVTAIEAAMRKIDFRGQVGESDPSEPRSTPLNPGQPQGE